MRTSVSLLTALGVLALGAEPLFVAGCMSFPERKLSDAEHCQLGQLEYCTSQVCAGFDAATQPIGCRRESDAGETDDETPDSTSLDTPGADTCHDACGPQDPSDALADLKQDILEPDETSHFNDGDSEDHSDSLDEQDMEDVSSEDMGPTGDTGGCSPGAPCDDGNPCTIDDRCSDDGACKGEAINCKDDHLCSLDSCDPTSGECVHDMSPCECLTDGDCDNGTACIVSMCKADGTCTHTASPDGTACGPVPTAGACHQGTCAGVAEVALGYAHGCALLETGVVRCWGWNLDGQLGAGNTETLLDAGNEVASTVELGTNQVTAIAAGGFPEGYGSHTCAITSNGEVRCWGANQHGQLGAGHTNNLMDDPGEVPSIVDLGGAAATAIALGGAHTCAIVGGGVVRCWGRNDEGQLGAGHTDNLLDEPGETASTVDLGGGTAVSVAAGLEFTCALQANGAVRCWGHGSSGQLGSGSASNIMDMPNQTPSLVDLDGVSAVSLTAGGEFACAVMSGRHTVRCWGNGQHGQLGTGSTTALMDDLGEAASSVEFPDNEVVDLRAGLVHVCAILDSGAVRCWGSGGGGALGNASADDLMDDPGEQPSTVQLGQVKAVQGDAGALFTCVVLEGKQVMCWGVNELGELGWSSAWSANGPIAPMPPAGFTNIMGAPGSVCLSNNQCLSDSCLATCLP